MLNRTILAEHITKGTYSEITQYQEQFFNPITSHKQAHGYSHPATWGMQRILFVEHAHVYTLGKSGKPAHLLASQEWLDEHNVEFAPTSRGGDITYHGPGQLVVYPILDLDHFKHDISWYMRNLEEAVIQCIAEFGIQGERLSGSTGVWLDVHSARNTRKICAMGVKLSRWVSMHGIGFNINPDLEFFQKIIPCGIQDKAVCSISSELNSTVTIAQVMPIIIQKLEQIFDIQIQFDA